MKSLQIHPYAQRDLVPAKLKQLQKELDLDAIGTIHVVDCVVDGTPGMWVVDGQHRISCLNSHDLGDWLVDVVVHTNIADNKEACRLFLQLNDRSPVSAYAKYAASLIAGDAVAVAIHSITGACGIAVAKHRAQDTTTAVAALRSAYSLDSGISLGVALGMLRQSWGGRKESFEGTLIAGLSAFVNYYSGKLDMGSLREKLARVAGGPSGLVGQILGLSKMQHISLREAAVCELRKIYNVGKRSGTLPEYKVS